MRVGVLALQGDWAAHMVALHEVGMPSEPVRRSTELDRVDALVMPGGESTSMLRLMEDDGMDRQIAERLQSGMPVLATCAGVILLAKGVQPPQRSLGILDLDLVRNAYGRQIYSRVSPVDVNGELGPPDTMDGVFIRAPRIVRAGGDIRVLGRLGADPVLVATGAVVAATFHPELTPDRRVHRFFVRLLEGPDA